ncbi:hypothetical protein AG1IA_03850 [Rhizoctonia solani AG-1 IA]|uniref:Uncharacterized protein n=1 Tax=Thanatephorus cucumeris (strain AG1-IA) TaxID=983506 RepID=L8WZ65_THACA|nr:hypothetical protein AG1IA_03850 [Rhizoctonia solani AG-1 IA]
MERRGSRIRYRPNGGSSRVGSVVSLRVLFDLPDYFGGRSRPDPADEFEGLLECRARRILGVTGVIDTLIDRTLEGRDENSPPRSLVGDMDLGSLRCRVTGLVPSAMG